MALLLPCCTAGSSPASPPSTGGTTRTRWPVPRRRRSTVCWRSLARARRWSAVSRWKQGISPCWCALAARASWCSRSWHGSPSPPSTCRTARACWSRWRRGRSCSFCTPARTRARRGACGRRLPPACSISMLGPSTSLPPTSGRGRARCRSLWSIARSGIGAACWPCCGPCCTGAISPLPCWRAPTGSGGWPTSSIWGSCCSRWAASWTANTPCCAGWGRR